MKSLKNKIIDKLEEYDIPITKQLEEDNEYVIFINDINIIIKSDIKEVFLSFYVNCKPSYASKITLILNEIKDIKRFDVGEEFVVNEDGDILDGEDAYKFMEEYRKKNIINDFIQEQNQVYLLNHVKPFNC